MQLQDAVILLPCSSLEDFPEHWTPSAAADVLSAWSLAWRPEVLAATEKIVSWRPAAAPPEELPNTLILAPPVSLEIAPAGWLDRIASDSFGAVVVSAFPSRPGDITEVIPGFDAASANPRVNQKIINDFLALGFCYLMVELQSRKMRYTSNLDSYQLQAYAVAAAQAALKNDEQAVRIELQKAYDALASARDYYYPVDSYLIDVTLVAPSVFGEPLRARLNAPTPANILICGEMLEAMERAEPESISALRDAVERGTASVVGGEFRELDWRLAPLSAVIDQMERGRATYERLLGRHPTIFGSRVFQPSAQGPRILNGFGFNGVLGAAFDGRRLPRSGQSKTQWSGVGDSGVDAVWRIPIDAAAADDVIRFAHLSSQAMDHDFVATLVLASWPGFTCPWVDDLRHSAEFSSALGRFVTLDAYFEASTISDAHLRIRSRDVNQIDAILSEPLDAISSRVTQRLACDVESEPRRRLFQRALAVGADDSRFDQEKASESGVRPQTRIVVNLEERARTIHVRGASESAASDSPAPLWGAAPTLYVADVPAFGFAVLSPNPPPEPPAPLAEGLRLQNEFIQIEFDAATGAIRGAGEYARRGPSTAQRIALRSPGAHYSVMAADSVAIKSSSAACGEMESRGRLLNPLGESLATFVQTTRLPRASRVALVEVEIIPKSPLDTRREESYFAARFAWPRGETTVRTSAHEPGETDFDGWAVAGDFLHFQQSAGTWTLFPMGLPLHRRVSETEFDTSLIVDGESARRFRFAIGVGIDTRSLHAHASALFGATNNVVIQSPQRPSADSAWLFHVDATNVRVVRLAQPRQDHDGVVMTLVETNGVATKTSLRCYRNAKTARTLSLANEPTGAPSIVNGAVVLNLKPHEMIRVEIDW